MNQFFVNSSVRDLDTRVNFKRSSTDFSLRYSSRSFKKCTALCSQLLKVGRDNCGKICLPLVVCVFRVCVCVIEQALPLKAFPVIPCEQPISVLSIIQDELDAQGSLTVLMGD
jgi:hypothetical protein